MEPAFLGLVLDSSVIIRAERNRQTVEDFLVEVKQHFGEIEVAISAVTVAELVHGVERTDKAEIRQRRRAFIDKRKKYVPVHPVTDETGELAGTLGGSQAARGMTIPIDDLLIGVSAIEQYAVATINRRHFEKIPGLSILLF